MAAQKGSVVGRRSMSGATAKTRKSPAKRKRPAAARVPVKGGDAALHRGLLDLLSWIAKAHQEIAALRTSEISREHIPAATDQLDAIVIATEKATNEIMDAAERMTSLASGAGKDLQDSIIAQATRIFEACGFQDITGQRVAKVVATLRHIERRLNDLAAPAVASNGAAESAAVPAPIAAQPPDPLAEARLLNGPQLPEKAAKQEDIDQLFAATSAATND